MVAVWGAVAIDCSGLGGQPVECTARVFLVKLEVRRS